MTRRSTNQPESVLILSAVARAMTNEEIRMTNQTANPKDESGGAEWPEGRGRDLRVSSLMFRHSFVIRTSDLVIAPIRRDISRHSRRPTL